MFSMGQVDMTSSLPIYARMLHGVRVCSHHEQSRAEQSGINVYVVLNVETLGCSHYEWSEAARSRAERHAWEIRRYFLLLAASVLPRLHPWINISKKL